MKSVHKMRENIWWCPKKVSKKNIHNGSLSKEAIFTMSMCTKLLELWVIFMFPWEKLEDFPGGSAGKESTCNVGDLGSIPGLGRSPGEAKGYPLQYSVLENSMDCIVHGSTKSQTQLNDFHFHRISYCKTRYAQL